MYPTIDDETDRLAAVARIDKEEAVRMARAHELQPREGSLTERIKPRQDAFAACRRPARRRTRRSTTR